MAEQLSRPLARLASIIDPVILAAPHTAGDTRNPERWPDVHLQTVSYLVRNAVVTPWINHLSLAAVVLSAARLDVATVLNMIQSLHSRLRTFYQAGELTLLQQWDADGCLSAYFRGTLVPDDSPSTRVVFWYAYTRTLTLVRQWLAGLPSSDRRVFAPYALPDINTRLLAPLVKPKQVFNQSREQRKRETDAVVPYLADIRAEAHLRWNRLARLRQACHDMERSFLQHPSPLPVAFSYDEGGDSDHGSPFQERLHFRLWDRRTSVLAHPEQFSASTLRTARNGTDAFAEAKNTRFIEFVGAERLLDAAPPAGLWFTELIARSVLAGGPTSGSADEIAAKQAWLRSWGYGDDCSDEEHVTPFASTVPGLLTLPASVSGLLLKPRQHAEGIVLPLESLYAAATFGLLALELFTTTGMRINEALQVRLDGDCLVRLVIPRGGQHRERRIRYSVRLLPKGERTEQVQDYFMSKETVNLLSKTAAMLAEHYHLGDDDLLPAVAFSTVVGRAHRFGAARYIFQYHHRHLSDVTLTSCLRFLLHGMTFREQQGKLVVLKAHLLRHVFATHAVQVERIPVDIVGAWLKQKHLDVTTYYSQPTDQMAAEAADHFLARIAGHIDINESVVRSPAELQRLYEEARGKSGTLAAVSGGECVSHGFCSAKFSCIGCPGKAPDPALRYQVERKKQWALDQIRLTTEEGLVAETDRMKQLVRDCEAELREMDLIEAYRKDENVRPVIRLEPHR